MRRDILALAFAMLFPSAMTWVYFVALAGESEGNNALQAAFGLGKLVQFLWPLVYVKLIAREQLRPQWSNGQGLAWGLGFGLATAAAMVGLYCGWLRGSEMVAQTPAQIADKLRAFGRANLRGYVEMALFYSLFHSLLEEYYWRWFVFGRLRRWLRLGPALLLSSLAFTSHHVIVLAVYFPEQLWTMALPFSLGVGIGGAVWAWLYERSGSLYAPWLSHLLVDAAIMAVGLDMVRAEVGA